tara:strand:- start:436 stop:810 length:375 start_codon:yes stop_codon:yes gene_type:complete
MLKSLKPFFIENSRVPVWLSKIAPIEIGAINIGIFVWSRGEMSETTKRHECIHFQQQLECLFLGQWILYAWYYLKGYLRHSGNDRGRKAYYSIPFEREAYDCEDEEDYLEKRKRYAWTKYKQNY